MDDFPFSKEDSFVSLQRTESYIAGKGLFGGHFSTAKASEALGLETAPTLPGNVKATSKRLFLHVSCAGES